MPARRGLGPRGRRSLRAARPGSSSSCPPSPGCPRALRGTSGRARPSCVGLVFGLGFMGGLLPWLRSSASTRGSASPSSRRPSSACSGVGPGPGAAGCRRGRCGPRRAGSAVEVLRGVGPLGRLPLGTTRVRDHRHPAGRRRWRWVGTAGHHVPRRAARHHARAGWCSSCRGPPAPAARGRWRPSRGRRRRGRACGRAPDASTARPARVQVAAVQGDVPGEGMDAFAERRAVLDNHVGATLGARRADRRGRSPRSPTSCSGRRTPPTSTRSSDPQVYADIQARRRRGRRARPRRRDGRRPRTRRRREPGHRLVSPARARASATPRRHPVPFGEYIPMRAQLAEVFERLDQIPRDMVPGHRARHPRPRRHRRSAT